MNSYPDAVAKIANDYLERVKSQLLLVPVREQSEFLAEIESHLYEAYRQRPEEDGVARILVVLRNLGEPAEVVSDRLPRTMALAGTKRNLPLYVVGGIFIAVFGLPLGFGGLGVLVGILAALAGMVVAFYATAGSLVLAGGLVTLVGLIRLLWPHLFDRLVMLDVIHLGAPTADFLDHFTLREQGLMMILFGSFWLAAGLGLLWLGKYLFRGLRFLFGLFFDRMRKLLQATRTKLRQENRYAPKASPGSVDPGKYPKPAR
jgi:uncharacterized membrane protein